MTDTAPVYAIRTDKHPSPKSAALGCRFTGWVHEGRPPWRVIVARVPEDLPDIGTPELYIGDEDTVTWERYVADCQAIFRAGGREIRVEAHGSYPADQATLTVHEPAGRGDTTRPDAAVIERARKRVRAALVDTDGDSFDVAAATAVVAAAAVLVPATAEQIEAGGAKVLDAADRMRDNWAEGNDARKQELWRQLHAVVDEARDALGGRQG